MINRNLIFVLLVSGLLASTGVSAEESKTKKFFGEVGDAVGGTLAGVGDTLEGTGDAIMGNSTPAEDRAEIDKETTGGLKAILAESSAARALHEKAFGYAIFDSRKFSFLLSTGGGAGVLVEKDSGDRTYMRMATAGGGVGMGMQFFHLLILFEDKETLESFRDKGWEANAAGSAVFGDNQLEKNARFVEGMAVFQRNEAGIMAALNITGTRYWKSEGLNKDA